MADADGAGILLGEVLTAQHERAESALKGAEARFREIATKAGLSCDWRADVAAWLKRHGVKAEAEARAHDDRSAGRRLLDCAVEMKAGVIVSGAWGHARMRQWIFGGVTQTLITESPVALLLAH